MSYEWDTLTGIVAWLDKHNLATREEMGLRILKCCEESGEAAKAWIGFTGQNPRKGITHSKEDVINELFDVALTALVAAESVHGGPVWNRFTNHMRGVERRNRETP